MNSINVLRRLLLKFILKVIGFENIKGHWVFSEILDNNSVVIDLGANKGSFSKEIYNKFGSICYVVEPNKSLLSEINYPSFIKLNYALSDKSGFIDFHYSNNDEASSIMPSISNGWGNRNTEKVKSLKWDDFKKKVNLQNIKIDVLKIDIEGAELDLIESFTVNNLSNVEQITVEFHDWIDSDLHNRTIACIKKLKQLGFHEFTDAPNHSWPIEMVFIKSKYLHKNTFKKLSFLLYNRIRFLKY